jgi:molybdopterin synthase sulfur carrier subunit
LRIKVQYFASVREIVSQREETLEVPEGTSVRTLLELLAAKHGNSLKKYIFDETGAARQHLQFLLDEKRISETGGLSTPLIEGSTLAIIPPVGGG